VIANESPEYLIIMSTNLKKFISRFVTVSGEEMEEITGKFKRKRV